jgi:transposase
LAGRLARSGAVLRFCYEAGPCGYGIQRQLSAAGHECAVVAPSLIPRRPGERVKTDRRDAANLAKLHRAGELTPVWVPDRAHEAIRDLVRARQAAVRALRQARQQLSGFLLRHGQHYGRPAWTQMHRRWLAGLRFEQPAHHLVLEDCIATIEAAAARRDRLEASIEAALSGWSLAPVVRALQALRGMALIAAATLVAELGDIARFDNPRQLMAYLGLVPSEHSSGTARRQGAITKAGNGAARRMLIEAAWSYRFPARISRELLLRQEGLTQPIRARRGRRRSGCAAATASSPGTGSPRTWSPPRSPANSPASSGRSPGGRGPPAPELPTLLGNTRGGRHPHRHIQSWARLEARSRPGEPSHPLPAGPRPTLAARQRKLRDAHHRSGGQQPAHQSMVNRRLMIVPPALPSRGHAERLDEQARNLRACCLKRRT